MKAKSLLSLLHTALVPIAFATAAVCAEDEANKSSFTQQQLEAKVAYCTTCHGLQAQGFRGDYPMPRLAGQQSEYIENQLRAFIERRRTNPIMFNVAHVLNPSMISALAVHFSKLNPPPIGGAPKEFIAEGRKIYEEGVPEANVPPCASCHGPEAKGNGAFPRLAGQLYDYILVELAHWSKKRGQDPEHPDTSAIMEPIAHSLKEPQIKAVAAYLSSLE